MNNNEIIKTMNTRYFIHRFVVVLVLLMAGMLPMLAWNYEKTSNDAGGGTYNFRTDVHPSSMIFNINDINYFKTLKSFDFEADNFYWEFEFQSLYYKFDSEIQEVDGEIFLVTADDVMHRLKTWKKAYGSKVISETSTERLTWGKAIFNTMSSDGKLSFKFYPTRYFFLEGVKRIVIKYREIWHAYATSDEGYTQFEKDFDISSVWSEDKPMPKLTIDWNDKGELAGTAINAMDKRNDALYRGHAYSLESYYVAGWGGKGSVSSNYSSYQDNINYSTRPDGNVDMTFGSWNLSYGAYTLPLCVGYHGSVEVVRSEIGIGIESYPQPTTYVIVKPYTSPTGMTVEFDKWKKNNMIRWTRQISDKVYDADNPLKIVDVECRTDGKWYVIRYEKGAEASDYTVVGSLSGDATVLEMQDSDIGYDKQYVYRVIFLPSVLENSHHDKLTELPGCARNPQSYSLFMERNVSTMLEMPIKLWQDRTYDQKVRLVWEYCVQPTAQNWIIEYSPAGENTWRVLDNSLTVDLNNTQAFFDADGSVCDMIDYRIKMSYADRDFYSNVCTGNLPAGSYISDVKATTGTEEKTVVVKWKVARADMTNDIYFRVLRRIIGETEWTLLTDEIHGTASEYSYTDDRPLAGSYYEYSVQAYGAKCDEQIVRTDEVITPGFSQARGTITGHISFGTGTAVAGVKVNLVKASADQQSDQPQFLSRYIEGAGKGLQWAAPDKEKFDKVLCGKGAFTIQLWVRPKNFKSGGAENQTILRLGNGLELGVCSDDSTNFYLNRVIRSNGTVNSHHFSKRLPFSATDFTHVTAVWSQGTLTCYVGTDTLLSYTQDDKELSNWDFDNSPALVVGGIKSMSGEAAGSSFSGYVDDIRLWDRALSREEIEANYTRILGGTENGLILYWPLDEGLSVKDYAFDVARQDGIYQLNHPEVGLNVTPSDIVPQHLGLYGVTDINGNYIIRGIPFQQGGTNYEIAPQYGIHEFNPNTRSMFVSPTSLTANNIDFEDVSSFPMEGYVYYAGTNVPAEGIQLYVDGEALIIDGEMQKTDSKGYYSISVPIGEHFVEAKQGDHKMVDGGRFPLSGKHNFTGPIVYDFLDSTLVNFVGRVSGGEKNDTLPVGFRASNNNIGVAVITLKLNNDGLSFNVSDKNHIDPALEQRIWQSDTTSIRSTAYSGIGSESRYIYIHTDPETGEFSAMLPPLKYVTKSIELVEKDKNPDVEFTVLPEIDLTALRQQLTDSLRQVTAEGDSVWNYYKYNTKMVKTYFAPPQIEVWQNSVDKDTDAPRGVFGLHAIKNFTDDFGTVDINDLWAQADDGAVSYRFGYPIYRSGNEVKMGIRGFETYTNYDSGKAVTDTIPMSGQAVTISNEMSESQIVLATVTTSEDLGLKPGSVYDLKSDQLALDKDGYNEFTWTAGLPNITKPYTRHLGINYSRNGRTYTWKKPLNAIVLGNLDSGSNFVTLGPDMVTMVLRDPPGSKSKTIWKKGHTSTKVRSESQGFYGNEKFTADLSSGVYIETEVGLGISAVSVKSRTSFDKTFGAVYRVNRNNQTDQTWSTATTEQISTGTGDAYVGSDGDVFIGPSLNYIIGDTRKLSFFRKGEGYPFELDLRTSRSLGDTIRTTFMYSTYELENVMIPKWEETRRGLLTFLNSEEEARNYVNTSGKCVYVTWLKPDDKNLCEENTYLQIAPSGWDGSFIPDSVMWCTDQIKSWRKRIADNEEDKVKAIQGTGYFQRNISFDGSTGFTYTSYSDHTYQKKHNYSHNLGGIVKLGTTSEQNVGGALFNLKITGDTENGWTMATTESDPNENFKDWAEFDYVFDDGNRDTDFSVSIYKSPSGTWSDIFSVIGGQSYNPYEGPEYTKYYLNENGDPYQLSNGTQQMEQPDIQISTDGVIAAKSAVLTDVPSGAYGQFTLHLTNNSFTNQGRDFTYKLSIAERSNQEGLEVLMDGVPIDGRGVYIPAGETVKKVITVRQTNQSVLDYEDVAIWFSSAFQPIKIHDIAKLSVHFKPSSSAVSLNITEPVLNSDSKDGKLNLKLTDIDRQFKNLKNVGVQYRFAGNTQWTTLHTWVTDKADSVNLNFNSLPATGDLHLTVDMKDDISFPEGNYEFRAFTSTPYGNELVQVYSDVVAVVKDMTKPRNLYVPSPANGILGYGDELSVEFNEDIVPGYVGDKNVIVTSKLNHQPVNHEVSMHLSRRGGGAHTENPIFLSGDFSTDFWLNRETAGTILQLGKGTNLFSLNFDSEGHAHVYIAGAELVSNATVPANVWTYCVLSYNSADHTLDMLAQWDTNNVNLFENEPVPQVNTEAIRYTSDNCLYLGPIGAKIHDLSLFSIYRDVNEAEAKKYQSKDNYVYGLVNYWPMNEGHGDIANDMRQTHDIILRDTWSIENTNYMLHIASDETAEADISRINTSRGDSYAIELWSIVNEASEGESTLFETGSTIHNRLRLYYDSKSNLWLDYGEKSAVVASAADFPKIGRPRQMALNVVRGQAASFYFNGQRTAVLAEADMPMMEGAVMKIGEGFNGFIDELRIWKATLSEDRLLNNMYNALDTAEVYSRGLVAYYPFEKAGTENGTATKVKTLENMAPGNLGERLGGIDTSALSGSSFPLKNAPDETRLIATPVASERKVVIGLTGSTVSARDIEGTTLNITLADIRDRHGNTSEPIKWTAYVQRNTLKWAKDSVNVVKKYSDDYIFDVDIENKSGQTEFYTLYNMPQWLTLVGSSRSDDLQALKTKTLRFQVNPLVAVGNYDVTIGLQGNNEILEPLRIVMKVSGEKPDWKVDPTKYDHGMTIIGQVYVNGILMENEESMVAAFIGNECRGVASPAKVRGAAYVTLNVYGNDTKTKDKDKAVTFRIWDASKGVAYTDAQLVVAGSAVAVTFKQDQMMGNFDQPAIWTKTDHVEQLIPIHENWNWIAFGVEPQSPYLDHVFSDYANWMLLIKTRDVFSDYNGAEWNGTLVPAVNTMYKLKVDRLPTTTSELNTQFSVSGRQLPLREMPVSLHKGWNWIGYTPLVTMAVGEALAGANPQKGDIVKSQTGVSIYGNGSWEGSLQAMESGHGYMYYSTSDEEKSFVYPVVASGLSRNAAPRRILGNELSVFTPVDKHLYPNNMTMVIQLRDAASVIDTAEVAAFVGDECRGAARCSSNGLYYLVIAGEGSGQPMVLRSCLDGKVVVIDELQTFVSDDNIGTSWEPYVINLSDLLSGINDATVTDTDDDDDWWTLQGIQLRGKPTHTGVYIHRGNKVIVKEK